MSHVPVLKTPAIEFLSVQPNAWYLDATFGAGGHSAAILAAGGKVIGLDYDEPAITAGKAQFADAITNGRLQLHQLNFARLSEVIQPNTALAGALFDFGTSSQQLMSADKGLSFQESGPLDMRLDPSLGVTAADLLNFLSVKELSRVLKELSGETEADKVAKAIKSHLPITTSGELAELVIKTKTQSTKLHPATKVFQALRILVNGELDNIKLALPQALAALQKHGRLVCISFHEGEDRLVKNFFQDQAVRGQLAILTKHPVTPDPVEVSSNPRSRSAKLRAAEKVI